jgi:drug/metabolite transporter (DMT)-like permease
VGSPAALGTNVLALVAMSLGTLYQKRHGGSHDLRTGNAVQFAAAGIATGLLALLTGEGAITWTGEFLFALLWSSVVLSLGAISLLFLLIRRGSAARVSSLVYMTPPCTALMAWLLFGETLSPLALVGMAAAVVGVALVQPGR